MDRTEALARRVAAQQLDRVPATRPLTDAAVLDLGVQDTGRDGASWALANRGVPADGPADLERADDLVLVWTVRSSPHYYRRADLPDVLDATTPYSEADARKRTLNAGVQLAKAGLDSLEGLAVVAGAMRDLVRTPMVKGEVSTALTAKLAAAYVRWCQPCGATHPYEVPFRLGALYGGLELTPGTSPPVLQPIPGWTREPGPGDPERAPRLFRLVENYLRFLGPASPADVAGFLDTTATVVKQYWPTDAEEVDVDGRRAWVLPGGGPADVDETSVRLLGPYDLFLQGRDRDVMVPDRDRHQALWPVIGRPGAVLLGTEIVGTWRPRASGRRLGLAVDLWSTRPAAVRERVREQAERLAAHRGVTVSTVEF